MTSTGAGPLLREWRGRRRRSQMDLALEAGVSPKHLSFVETGRSRPSPELLLTLARHLDVPLRERNSLLLAAGYAPRYHETAIDDPASQRVRASLERLLRTHDPYPGVVLNRRWDIVLANDAALQMIGSVPAELLQPVPNVFRFSLHPAGVAAITLNFDEWATYLLAQLRRLVASTGDADLADARIGGAGLSQRRRAVGPHRLRSRRGATAAHAVPVDGRRRRAVAVHDADDVRDAARHHARRARGGAVLPRRRRNGGDPPRPVTMTERLMPEGFAGSAAA